MILALDPGSASVIVAAITSATGLILAWLESLRRAVKSTRQHISNIDKSVNGVPDGTPPLVSRVSALEERQVATDRRQDATDRWMTDALTAIGGQLGVGLPDRKYYN